jgi:hypothetical protein
MLPASAAVQRATSRDIPHIFINFSFPKIFFYTFVFNHAGKAALDDGLLLFILSNVIIFAVTGFSMQQ